MAFEESGTATTDEFRSPAYDLLSGLLLASAVTLVALMGLSLAGTYGGPLFLLPGLGGLVAPVLLYFDADRLSRETEHDPRVGRLAVASLLVTYFILRSADASESGVGVTVFLLLTLVGPLYYVDRRRRYVAESVAWEGWVRVAQVLATGALLLLALAWTGVLPSSLDALPWLVAAPYPAAVYWDACHVRGREGGWTPTPGLHLFAAAVGAALLPLLSLHVAYYSFMRG